MKSSASYMTVFAALMIAVCAIGPANAQDNAAAELDPSLQPLEWQLGKWVHRSQTDDGKPLVVMRSCIGSLDGHYLSARTLIRVDGEEVLSHQHKVRWDPAREKHHSWVFSSNGDFAHGSFQQIATQVYQGQLAGQTFEGKRKTGVSTYTRVDADTYIYTLRERKAGNQSLPDIEWDFHRVTQAP